jgi:ribosomal silencing factor RsfS
VLKKLDGYPVIREVLDEEKEEDVTTLDIREIQNMAEKLDAVSTTRSRFYE